MTTYKEILDYWFDARNSTDAWVHLWFAGTPEIDEDIRTRFEPLVLEAACEAASDFPPGGRFSDWRAEPEGCLALLILLDQFPLNIYRDQARSFEIVDLALPIALQALAQGFDQKVPEIHRLFFYLPLEHSEDLNIQRRCVKLFERLAAEAAPHEKKYMDIFLDYAIRHLVVIERFGRYPDRNPILGRTHRPEEAEYMAQGGPPF